MSRPKYTEVVQADSSLDVVQPEIDLHEVTFFCSSAVRLVGVSATREVPIRGALYAIELDRSAYGPLFRLPGPMPEIQGQAPSPVLV